MAKVQSFSQKYQILTIMNFQLPIGKIDEATYDQIPTLNF